MWCSSGTTRMLHTIATRLRNARFVAYRHTVHLFRQLEARYPVDPRPAGPPAPPAPVKQALRLSPAANDELQPCTRLIEAIGGESLRPAPLSSREIFSFDGVTLPCWLESDLYLEDDWLTSAANYPLYYALFQRLTRTDRKTRMLEIGVRTGYIGVVLARAARGPSLYLGVDPNLYVANGLQLAADTFAVVRDKLLHAEALLLEGYSWDSGVQKTLSFNGPFDIVHIDGDHSLVGKLIDLHLARQVLAEGGVVLVDDYDHIPVISDAIRRAFRLGWFNEFAYVPTKRGLALLR
jgi:predicted O-methyltransferase YrrM